MNSIKIFYYMAVMSQTLYNTATTPIEFPIRISSARLRNPILLFKKNYIEWMVPILHVSNFKDWNYLCYGALVHPRVVLSADQPFDENFPSLYAVGIYNWNNTNSRLAQIDLDHLFNISHIRRDLQSKYEFIESDSSRININRIAILVLTSPINSVRPLNIEKSLTINDILRNNMSKHCLHIRILENVDPDYYSPILNSTIFQRTLSTEYLITNLTTLNNVNKILMSDWSPTNFNLVTHSYANNNSQTFFSVDSWRLNTDPLLGSPILCQSINKTYSYSLAGILTDTINGLFQYSTVNNNSWIIENLNQILKTL